MNELKVLFFEITKKCNAHCEHCGSRCDINSEEGISKELFMSVLDDVKENIGIDTMLNITGGEPLLRKDLFEIMGYAKKLGFDWGMVTNGTLISDSIIENMKKTKMSTISISIDGMKNTHESFRHLPGSFDKIIQNIIKLKKEDFLDHIQVTFIANKKNLYELPALWRLLKTLNIDSLRISCIDPIGRAEDNKDLLLDSKDFEYLFNFINNANKLKELQCVWSCSHYFNNDNKPDILGRHFTCHTGTHVASILSDGSIFVCPNVPRLSHLIQGNIKKDKFSEIWKTKFEPFRNRHLNDTCNKCEKKEFCNGDSFHTWDFENNKPKFCYKEVFKENKKQNNISFDEYKQYINNKYESLEIIKIKSLKDNNINVIIEPEAYKDLEHIYHIDKKHPLSMYEQQVGLVGFKIDNNYIIKYVFPSILKNRTRNMGYVDKSTIEHALEESEIIKENFYLSDDKNDLINGELKFLGFAHSHPLDTEFCYSDGDYKFHKYMVDYLKDYISILINPSDNLIACFSQEDVIQVNLIILNKK